MWRPAALAGALFAAACAAPPPIPPAAPLPRPGDTWTYRLAERPIGRAPAQSSYVVKVAASSAASIFDQASRDGGPPIDWTHHRGQYIGLQGVAIFSPYLAVFENPVPGTSTSGIEGCFFRYQCVTRSMVVGWEAIQVPAGSFDALKVTVEQEWKLRPLPRAAHEEGVLRLTIWYSPQAKRAVKVSSRLSGQGGRPPFDADFDLELTSYQLK